MCDDYIAFTDDPCPKCGNTLVSKPCNDCGGEGMTQPGELYEQDPLWYDQDDWEYCRECRGHGHFVWCQKCGWDHLEQRFLNGKPAIELPKSA